jgi:hypothetical protein
MNRVPRVGRTVLYALIALIPLSWAAAHSNLNSRATLEGMVRGTAYRPYVYRTLTPRLVGALDSLLPAGVRTSADSLIQRKPALRERWRWPAAHGTWFAWNFVIQWCALVLFASSFERLANAAVALGGDVPRLASAAFALAEIALAGVPLHFGFQNFVYDFPELALFTLALALLAERRWIPYLAAFTLALINKETSVLLCGVFVIWAWDRMPRARLAAWVAVQGVIAAGVLLAIRTAYAHAPGEPLEFHLARNLHYHPALRQLRHDAIYAAFWIVALTGAALQRRVAIAALFVGAVLLGFMLFFGFFGEYRDFYEVYPLAALLVAGRVATSWPRARPA